MILRWHGALKAALMARDDPPWSVLFVLLGVRTAQREKFTASSVEMVYEDNLRLPADPLLDIRAELSDSRMLRLLRGAFSKMRPTPQFRHTTAEVNTPRDLEESTQLLIRVDALWRPLQTPSEGHFKVLERGDHSFKLDVRSGPKWVFLLSLKAFNDPVAAKRDIRPVSLIDGITWSVSSAELARFQRGVE